jgi:hypothetical protein
VTWSRWRGSVKDGKMGVDVESLESVWLDSKCRIDNSLDARHPPQRKGEEIKELALKYAKREKDFGPYDLENNNCEHFASWVRNGKMCSQQVTNTKQHAKAWHYAKKAMAGTTTSGVTSAAAEIGIAAGKTGVRAAGKAMIITSAVFVVWDAVDLGIAIKDLVKKKGSEAGNVLRKEARRKEDELEKFCCCGRVPRSFAPPRWGKRAWYPKSIGGRKVRLIRH